MIGNVSALWSDRFFPVSIIGFETHFINQMVLKWDIMWNPPPKLNMGTSATIGELMRRNKLSCFGVHSGCM